MLMFLLITDVKVSGINFLRYTLDQNSYNLFTIDRSYINFSAEIFKHNQTTMNFRFTTDITQITDTNLKSLRGSYYLFSKYAFIQVEHFILQNLNFYFGQTYNFWIKKDEDLWKNRFIEKVAEDYFGLITSADLGLALEYKQKPYEATLGIYNGEGYNRVEDNKQKDLQFTGSIYPTEFFQFPLKFGIHTNIYYGLYKNDSLKLRYIGGLSLESKYLDVLFTYDKFKGKSQVQPDTTTGELISSFITLKPINFINFFIRYDKYKESNFFLTGFIFNIDKNFRLSTNYKSPLDSNFSINVQSEVKF